jgi:hypothetical protein
VELVRLGSFRFGKIKESFSVTLDSMRLGYNSYSEEKSVLVHFCILSVYSSFRA